MQMTFRDYMEFRDIKRKLENYQNKAIRNNDYMFSKTIQSMIDIINSILNDSGRWAN